MLSCDFLAVATSAVAEVLLDEGRTAHSTFSIPITCTAESTCSISVVSSLAEQIKDTDMIIWDEAEMCQKHCIEAVDRSIQDITGSRTSFDGKCMLLCGEFRQILPGIPEDQENK